MKLTSATSEQSAASEIELVTAQTVTYLQSSLKRIYQLVNNSSKPQGILSAFGTNAASALEMYKTFHTALNAVEPNNTVISFDETVYVDQEDGKVKYVAPKK